MGKGRCATSYRHQGIALPPSCQAHLASLLLQEETVAYALPHGRQVGYNISALTNTCLLSALRFHHLGTQNPFEVWLAIGRKAWRPRVEHPPLRLVYLSGASFEEGVEVQDVEGVPVRVFCAAKTVADCFKFRHKIGTDVAVEALRSFRESRPKELADVWRYAQVDRVGRVIAPYLEALT